MGMSGSRPRVKGVHRYRSKGRLYVYAWRGGPRIHAPEGTPEFLIELAEAHRKAKEPPKGDTLLSVIHEYKRSRQFQKLAPATRADHERNFEVILKTFADAPMSAFDKPAIRRVVRRWHEAIEGDRAADKALGTLSRLLNFAASDGLVMSNATASIEKRYERELKPTPWTEEELARYIEAAPPYLARVAILGAATGLARADLARVSWSHVRPSHIEISRKKSDQITRVTITPDLRVFLDDTPRQSTAILLNSRGLPWTSDGLGKSFDKLRSQVGIEKTLHDLRALRACRLYGVGFTDDEVADEMGWSLKTVRYIRRYYVNQEALFQRRVVRLRGTEHE